MSVCVNVNVCVSVFPCVLSVSKRLFTWRRQDKKENSKIEKNAEKNSILIQFCLLFAKKSN